MPGLTAYVAVPALVVGLLSSLLASYVARADVRVTGTVSLSVLAGNELDYKLNAYAAGFATALASPAVERAVDTAAGGPGRISGLRAEREDEASEMTVSLTADGRRQGERALLVAGRTALRLLAQDRHAELVERQASAQRAVQRRVAGSGQAPPVAVGPQAVDPVSAARDRAVVRAVEDLAEVDGDLAVVRELLATDPVPGVSVDEVAPMSPVRRALLTSVTSGLAAALVGAIVLWHRRSRRLTDLPPGGDGLRGSDASPQRRAEADRARSDELAASA